MTMLTVQHSSLFVFDSPGNKVADANKIFTTGADLINGTEAGAGSGITPEALARAAKRNGYLLWLPHPQDSWVAVSLDIVKPDSRGRQRWSETGCIPVLKSAKAAGDKHGPYSAKGLPWATFASTIQDRDISDGAGHWLTKGRSKGQTPAGPLNHYDLNMKMAATVGDWAKEKGRGRALVFYSADTNIVDRHADVFRGLAPMTTCWDEVGKWPNTGHGNIDVIASLDKDRAVECVGARVWTDKEFHLNTDHFMITARYKITG